MRQKMVKNYKRTLLALLSATILTVASVSTGGCATMGKSPEGPRLQYMQTQKNFKSDTFLNQEKTVMLEPGVSRWGLFYEFLFNKSERTVPKKPPEIVKLNKDSFAKAPAGDLRVTWLGHSSFLVEISGRNVLVDPVFSKRASPFQWVGPKRFHEVPVKIKELPPIDAVVISHDHYDHLDHSSIVKLNKKTKLFIVPLGVGSHLEAWGISNKKIKELNWWQQTSLNGIDYVATPARHFSGRSLFDENETLWSSWVIKSAKSRLYYSGDTGYQAAFKKIGNKYGPFDVSLVQIGAYDKRWAQIHMTPEQGVRTHIDVKAGLMIPVHWGTFDLGMHDWDEPRKLTKTAAKKYGINYALPKPGEMIEFAKQRPIAAATIK